MIPKKCPRCGSTSAYTKEVPVGTCYVYYDLEKTEVEDASSMYESLSSRGGTVLYCYGCGKRLGPSAEFVEEAWEKLNNTPTF